MRRLRQQQQYVTQQKEIARLEAMIERFERWAKQVLSRKPHAGCASTAPYAGKMEERGEIIRQSRPITRLMDFKSRRLARQQEGP